MVGSHHGSLRSCVTRYEQLEGYRFLSQKSTAGGNNSATALLNCCPARSVFDSRIPTELMNPFCALVSAPSDSPIKTFIKLVSEGVEELDAPGAGSAANESP